MFYAWRSLKTVFQFLNAGEKKDQSTSFSGSRLLNCDIRGLGYTMSKVLDAAIIHWFYISACQSDTNTSFPAWPRVVFLLCCFSLALFTSSFLSLQNKNIYFFIFPFRSLSHETNVKSEAKRFFFRYNKALSLCLQAPALFFILTYMRPWDQLLGAGVVEASRCTRRPTFSMAPCVCSSPQDLSHWTQSVSVCCQHSWHHSTKCEMRPRRAVEVVQVQQFTPLMNGSEGASLGLVVEAVVMWPSGGRAFLPMHRASWKAPRSMCVKWTPLSFVGIWTCGFFKKYTFPQQ